MILDASLAVPEAVEKDTQRRDIEAALIDRVELSAHGLLGLDRKGAVKGAARGREGNLLAAPAERVAEGGGGAAGMRPRLPRCPFGRPSPPAFRHGRYHSRDLR